MLELKMVPKGDGGFVISDKNGARAEIALRTECDTSVALLQQVAGALTLNNRLVEALRMARAEINDMYSNTEFVPGLANSDNRPIIVHVDEVLADAGIPLVGRRHAAAA